MIRAISAAPQSDTIELKKVELLEKTSDVAPLAPAKTASAGMK